MAAENLPPIERPFDVIAANLAHEGVPVQVIARAMQRTFSDVHVTLKYFIEVGGITEMPVSDWPPGQKRSDRLPQFLASQDENVQVYTVQRGLKLTRLMASFMLVMLRRAEADKDTLHYVIETQRSMRRSRPDKSETTDPKMVDVVVCNLRKRLKPFGVKIKTLWGRGYYIDDENREKVEGILAAVKGAPPGDDADLE